MYLMESAPFNMDTNNWFPLNTSDSGNILPILFLYAVFGRYRHGITQKTMFHG
jgi:hypothetical protein